MPNSKLLKSRLDCAEALAMYNRGGTDREIAQAFEVDKSAVCHWRRKRGLPSKWDQSQKPSANSMTSAEKRTARKMLRNGATRGQVAAAIGRHPWTIQQIRKSMLGDPRLRGPGSSLLHVSQQLDKNLSGIWAALKRATRHVTDPVLRDDVIGEMWLALLEDRLKPEQIATEAKVYSGRAYGLWQSPFGPVPLDREISEDGFTLGDTIACPRSLEWVEEMGG